MATNSNTARPRFYPGLLFALLLALTVTGIVGASASAPQVPATQVSTAFTYQGKLADGGSPANGSYDFLFSPFDAASGGLQVANSQIREDVAVVDGFFTVTLDFGTGLFEGDARWLEVDVRPGASTGSYTTLSPRTLLTAVPYAQGLLPGVTVNTTQTNLPALRLNAPNANSNALVATGNGNGYAVVFGEDASAAGGYGVYGKSTYGSGVFGQATGLSGTGVLGSGYRGMVANGWYVGVQASGDTYGIDASSSLGYGVYGSHTGATGLFPGVAGTTFSTSARAVGVEGRVGSSNPGSSSAAVLGYNEGLGASGIGVWGEHWGTGYGVYGRNIDGGYAIVGDNGGSNSSGYAGWFNGRVAVLGTLSKGGGSFKIDHPLDPANKTLSHSFVESPDMLNIYNGNVTTDADGFATVTLPDWFEALNRDFRYQLTVIGQFAQAIVAEEIQGNQFRIQTDKPGVKVSWQVTGIRHDPFAEAYRIPVEEDKAGAEKGHYLYPEVYGKSVRDSVWYVSSPNARYNIDHPEGPERLRPERAPRAASDLEQPEPLTGMP